ncbi:DNA-binding SARP family transcriptional activator [Streptomyces brevispora]|uniref:DNA-binding SARP family transcriptional activator n=1 Tax=Streptomyces brevispora TaxID=887462 RepID=A0A561V5G2_9ACTN|nr:AfsR/SARP family transcriptional regulator [Streptomyces brevispora]TWG06845.1 DNA-binding SARP family transcriptional activator [Streptomyces brevispora]
MEFRILGPVEARHDGTVLPLAGAKIHTVLTALLLARGRVVSDSRLSEFLWGWSPPTTMNAQIYTYISRLRKQFGDGIDIARCQPGYALDAGASWIDSVEYDRLDRLGREALEARHFEKASTLLAAALELWRGTPFASTTEFLCETVVPQWEEAWSTTLGCRIEADLALGRHHELIAELTRLVAEHPLNERLRAQLMTALYRASRQGDALSVYRQGRSVLREELGIDPGPALREVHRQVLDGSSELGLQRWPRTQPGPVSGVTVGAAATMLPPDVSHFTGHALPLSEVVYELRGAAHLRHSGQQHPVVITGMPGSGKSALAVRAAHLLRGQFADGQLYADLGRADGSRRDPHAVLQDFLHVLGVPAHAVPGSVAERVQLYRGLLTDRRVLVVLDDVVDAAQVAPLLPTGARSRAILTSRTPTVLDGAFRLIRLHPLSTGEALALLSAVAGPERVASEPAAADSLAELCDRSPLALRICASRLAEEPGMRVAELLSRLLPAERRLDELRHGGLDVRAGLRSSYATLPTASRQTLHRLTVLPRSDFSAADTELPGAGEWGAEEALEVLADARLIDVTGVGVDHRLVYRLPSLVRLFAQEQEQGWGQAQAQDRGARVQEPTRGV